ncbi:hypothetical protein RRG08_042776 [Elysia crispata]|uniref:Uncharacterized protein n=1 Tax=Elysia crispata TaxID=231223 RepID=A0AAE0XQH8_9GAST|nr:hypothetical protein RRG08_042776 [Elysia crispata]
MPTYAPHTSAYLVILKNQHHKFLEIHVRTEQWPDFCHRAAGHRRFPGSSQPPQTNTASICQRKMFYSRVSVFTCQCQSFGIKRYDHHSRERHIHHSPNLAVIIVALCASSWLIWPVDSAALWPAGSSRA